MMILISLLLFFQSPRATVSSEYVVGPQDRLAITVFDEPSLTKTVTVDGTGEFDFPYIGKVKAAGLSVRAIEADLKKRLGPPTGVLVAPQVSIEVETYRSQVVYVNGQVHNPGAVPLKGNMTIMDILAAAGSVTAEAGAFVEVYHRGPGQTTGPVDAAKAAAPARRVTMEQLRNGDAQSIVLADGDTINVPKAQTFIVNGYVRNPGTFIIDGEITVQKALAMAGGVTERGAANRTRITRFVNGKLIEIKKLKMSDLVQPNDTLNVPQRFF